MPVTCGIFPPPNGRQLLTTSLDSTLVLWEISSSTPAWKLSTFAAPNSPDLDPSISGITSLAVSPNGQIAAVGGANGLVKIISIVKGEILSTLRGHSEGESVEALEFVDLLGGAGGGKGVVLVSGGTDGKGFVWDVNTGRVRAELKHDVSGGSRRAVREDCSSSITGTHNVPRTTSCASSAPADLGIRRWLLEDLGH
jgi:ribosome assembly protein SQT1